MEFITILLLIWLIPILVSIIITKLYVRIYNISKYNDDYTNCKVLLALSFMPFMGVAISIVALMMFIIPGVVKLVDYIFGDNR